LSDIGATGIFIRESDKHLLNNIIPDQTVEIVFPNNTIAMSIGKGEYQPTESITPVQAAIFRDEDLRQTIIGISPLCHEGQEVLFTETTMDIIKKGKLILRTFKKPGDKLWTFPKHEVIYKHLSNKQEESVSQVIRNDLNAAYVEYMSAAL
jgi:hypothetical protein